MKSLVSLPRRSLAFKVDAALVSLRAEAEHDAHEDQGRAGEESQHPSATDARVPQRALCKLAHAANTHAHAHARAHARARDRGMHLTRGAFLTRVLPSTTSSASASS